MSSSKLSEQIIDKHFLSDHATDEQIQAALDEMALRVFEDTRERAAKLAESLWEDGSSTIWCTECEFVAEAIRAMQPDGK